MNAVDSWRAATADAERRIRTLQDETERSRRERVPDRDRLARLLREIDRERRRIVELESHIRRSGGR